MSLHALIATTVLPKRVALVAKLYSETTVFCGNCESNRGNHFCVHSISVGTVGVTITTTCVYSLQFGTPKSMNVVTEDEEKFILKVAFRNGRCPFNSVA